jgi:tetratricopeptide (TPR) repeat protein
MGKDNIEEETSVKTAKEETSLTNADYQRNRLFRKGILYMADEKLEEACRSFEMILRTDPNDVDALLKLGYSRFHLEDYTESMRVYDKVLDIDITNSEAWNLKSLVNYEKKNYAKALDCTEKALDSDPTYAMAWYNKACYLSMLNQVSESIDSLKRSIEIDVKNARKAVKDKDFVNVRAEEGFKNIIEVVVIESLRQGYHTIGAIVWTTFLSKEDALKSLNELIVKGLVVKNQKRQDLRSIIDVYDLIPEMAKKLGQKKRGLLGTKSAKQLTVPIKNLKEIGIAIQSAKSSIEQEDVDKIIDNLEMFIEPTKCGQQMIEEFLEEHREIRLYKVRLNDKGLDFVIDNKKKMLEFFENLEIKVTKKLRTSIPQN